MPYNRNSIPGTDSVSRPPQNPPGYERWIQQQETDNKNVQSVLPKFRIKIEIPKHPKKKK